MRIRLPRGVHVAGQAGSKLTSTLQWTVPQGSLLRLQQLFAQLGYLPLKWKPFADPPSTSESVQLAAAVAPPRGRFSWRYPNTPASLRSLWQVGADNEIIRGAVSMFENVHGMAADGLPGPKVWAALIGDAIAGKRDTNGYDYVFVHRSIPQSLNLGTTGA